MALVPKRIHQTWRSAEPPAEWAAFAASWRAHHPAWEYKLWTDAEARDLVARHRPRLLSVYDAYPYAIQRADAFRYVAVWALGGVYADLDIECLRPLDTLLGDHALVIAREPQGHVLAGRAGFAGNAFIAARPGHAFLASVLERLEASEDRALTHLDVLRHTGPLMFDDALREYPGGDVTVVASETIYPLAGGPNAGDLARENGSFAIHYWANTWVKDLAGPLRNPEPSQVAGYRFFQGWDSGEDDLENGGRDIAAVALRCRERRDSAGFNTDGFIKSHALLARRWQQRPEMAWNEGLYVKKELWSPMRRILSRLSGLPRSLRRALRSS